MIGAGFVWTGLGVGWVMGSGVGTVWVKAGWFVFCHLGCCLAWCAESDSFHLRWGLTGLACWEGWWPRVGCLVWAWTVLFFFLWGLWLG